MKAVESVWVLGHKIRLLDTDVSYGLVEITSLPGVPGPPPHFHKDEREFFLIVNGALDIMVNGEWRTMSSGSFAELPPNTVHTFINNTKEDVIWLTGWRPKGFQRFFRDFGIPVAEENAQSSSVADALVQKVVQNVERYGMYIAP